MCKGGSYTACSSTHCSCDPTHWRLGHVSSPAASLCENTHRHAVFSFAMPEGDHGSRC